MCEHKHVIIGMRIPREYRRYLEHGDLAGLDYVSYSIAEKSWRGASDETALQMIKRLDETVFQTIKANDLYTPIEAAICLAAIENETNINALLDAGLIPLYSPITLRPTHKRNGALVEEAVVAEKLASGEHLQYTSIEPSKKPDTEKPLTQTERTTLLTTIAALCDYSKIKYQERGAAAQIARLTEASGTPVNEDTISRALKKIPIALETRMK